MCEIQPPTWYLRNRVVISWQEPGYIEIDTVGKLTRRSQLGSLALCSVNNDFAWLCNSWDHLQHCACPSWGTLLVMSYPVHHACMSSTMKALAAAALELHWSDTMVMLCAQFAGRFFTIWATGKPPTGDDDVQMARLLLGLMEVVGNISYQVHTLL